MDIKPGLVHQMEALEDAELFEFSTQHFDSDSHRLTSANQRSDMVVDGQSINFSTSKTLDKDRSV
jgi:hypothetical protein